MEKEGEDSRMGILGREGCGRGGVDRRGGGGGKVK